MNGYTGRFAPTPSGPLHAGSIVTALGSYLDARRAGGRWLVRIDDIDRRRARPGVDLEILCTLENLGLRWDGTVLRQSTRADAYATALATLAAAGLVYPCTCPRKEVAGIVYPGTCRDLRVARGRHALRLRTDARTVSLRDAVQGARNWLLERDAGDFIVYRADHVYAYHLAAAVDDAWQDVTHVVRGADLLDSTLPQIHVQQCLGLPRPHYAHLPLLRDARGRKLSKRDQTCTKLLEERPQQILVNALAHLGQQTEPDMAAASCEEILAAAVRRWDIGRVPRADQAVVPRS